MRAYDPEVTVDLHTTNGTRHAYHLTYAPPLHPGTDPALIAALRGEWLPAITAQMKASDWLTTYYGNLPFREGVPRGWYTFDHRPRFNNNYFGLRNRIAILSEAYAYSPFRERVASTLDFVRAILDYASGHAAEARALVRAADAAPLSGSRLPLRAELARTDPLPILLGEVRRMRHPLTGAVVLERTAAIHEELLPQYGTFTGTALEVVPRAYLLPADDATEPVIDVLRAHGVELEVLPETARLEIERFHVSATRQAPRPFEGHRLRTVEGSWQAESALLPRGAWRVPVDQPLGRLLFYLLEPRSDDGFAAWGAFEEALESGTYPVLRAP